MINKLLKEVMEDKRIIASCPVPHLEKTKWDKHKERQMMEAIKNVRLNEEA